MTAKHPSGAGAARSCPICGKPASGRHGPFCSARCQSIDLGRWLKGDYRVRTNERPAESPTGDAEQ